MNYISEIVLVDVVNWWLVLKVVVVVVVLLCLCLCLLLLRLWLIVKGVILRWSWLVVLRRIKGWFFNDGFGDFLGNLVELSEILISGGVGVDVGGGGSIAVATGGS